MVTFLLLAGCSLDKKIGESITEGILEKAGGEDADINIDGEDFSITTEDGEMTFDEDGYSFEGEDGEEMTISGDNEWPEGTAADLIPKFDKGKITATMNLDTGCTIVIEEVEKDDYTEYIEKVKDAGFTTDQYESTSEDMSSYAAYLDEKTNFSIYYFPPDKNVTITLTIDDGEN